MLSKCANPACLARFHYLHEGRIFKIETATVLSVGHSSPNHRIEHFWLCERCAQTLSVVLENGGCDHAPTPPAACEKRVGRQFWEKARRRVAGHDRLGQIYGLASNTVPQYREQLPRPPPVVVL